MCCVLYYIFILFDQTRKENGKTAEAVREGESLASSFYLKSNKFRLCCLNSFLPLSLAMMVIFNEGKYMEVTAM